MSKEMGAGGRFDIFLDSADHTGLYFLGASLAQLNETINNDLESLDN